MKPQGPKPVKFNSTMPVLMAALASRLAPYSFLLLFIALIIIASIISPKFLALVNIMNLMQQSAVPGITSIGMTLVILVGEIDLSVGSVAALGGMISAVLLDKGVVPVLAVAVALLAGIAVGLVNGLVVTYFRVPAFIATLATMTAARGLTLLMTDGKPVFGLPAGFRVLGSGFIGPFPVSGLLWIAVGVLAALMLKYTPFGRSLYAIGGNAEAARLSGIRVRQNKILVFMASGCLASLAGVVMASWLGAGQPTEGAGLELTAIAAVVLGGTSMLGGVGGALSTLLGTAMMTVITNLFNLLGVSSYYQQIFMGLIMVLAVTLNIIMNSIKGGAGRLRQDS